MPRQHAFVDNWPALLLRGSFGIVIGLALPTTPRNDLAFLTVLFGSFLIADGLFAVASSMYRFPKRGPWLLPAAQGFLTVALGVLSFRIPVTGPIAFGYLVATYALTRGALETACAIELQREGISERALAGSALVSLLAGGLLAVLPHFGTRGVVAVAATQCALGGILLLAQARRMKRRKRLREEFDPALESDETSRRKIA